MWIITNKGFYSIVQKPWDIEPRTLTVRSRIWSDLAALRGYIPNMGDIKTSDQTDYPYRIRAPKKDLALALAKLVKQISYNNFKTDVQATQGNDRAAIYAQVWQLLTDLETIDNEEAEGKWQNIV